MRPLGTEHPPRAILAAHEVKHLDHLVSRSSYPVKLVLQAPAVKEGTSQVLLGRAGLEQRRMACADKAHQVDGDGGAEACSSTPQAASTSTLVALQPPLGACGPRCQTSFLALGSC